MKDPYDPAFRTCNYAVYYIGENVVIADRDSGAQIKLRIYVGPGGSCRISTPLEFPAVLDMTVGQLCKHYNVSYKIAIRIRHDLNKIKQLQGE